MKQKLPMFSLSTLQSCSLLQKHDISRATKTHVDVHFAYLAQPLPLSALLSPKCVSLTHLTTHRPSYTYQSWPIIYTQHWQNLYCNYGFYFFSFLESRTRFKHPDLLLGWERVPFPASGSLPLLDCKFPHQTFRAVSQEQCRGSVYMSSV
jgi:hypothetical protein